MNAAAPTCPECGELLEGNLGRVPAAVNGGSVVVAIDCPGCASQLELFDALEGSGVRTV